MQGTSKPGVINKPSRLCYLMKFDNLRAAGPGKGLIGAALHVVGTRGHGKPIEDFKQNSDRDLICISENSFQCCTEVRLKAARAVGQPSQQSWWARRLLRREEAARRQRLGGGDHETQ